MASISLGGPSQVQEGTAAVINVDYSPDGQAPDGKLGIKFSDTETGGYQPIGAGEHIEPNSWTNPFQTAEGDWFMSVKFNLQGTWYLRAFWEDDPPGTDRLSTSPISVEVI